MIEVRMRQVAAALFMCLILCMAGQAQGQQTPPPVTPAPMDIVTLKDGSVIYGEVTEMSDGQLKIKTTFGVGDFVGVNWDTVSKLSVNHPIPFHLKDGSILMATVEEGPEGMLLLKVESMTGTLTVPIESIKVINPLIQPPVVYSGGLTSGLSQNSGNSHLRSASLLGDLTGRSESLRLTLLGRYIYGDDH